MQEKIFEMLFDEDEITWRSIIYRLINEEQMDPWDVNVSLLSKKYIQMLKKLKELDFRISGKVILAAAILLKIKSNRLMGSDMAEFDRLMAHAEDSISSEGFYDELQHDLDQGGAISPATMQSALVPRTPQPRLRKVSVYDLMEALQKALEVKQRRVIRNIPEMPQQPPQKTREITEIIVEVYEQIKRILLETHQNKVLFDDLIPSDTKEDKVYTFIPLLHLENQRKVELLQKEHFGPINVILYDEKHAS